MITLPDGSEIKYNQEYNICGLLFRCTRNIQNFKPGNVNYKVLVKLRCDLDKDLSLYIIVTDNFYSNKLQYSTQLKQNKQLVYNIRYSYSIVDILVTTYVRIEKLYTLSGYDSSCRKYLDKNTYEQLLLQLAPLKDLCDIKDILE
jgi:hypothetical protein